MTFPKYVFSVEGILQILILMTIIARNLADIKDMDNYGPYTVDYTGWNNCAGPKMRNLTSSTAVLTKYQERFMVNINFTFLTQCHIEEVKLKTYRVEKNEKKLLLNYKIDNPCQHYAIASLIEKYFGADKCAVKKGTIMFTACLENITRAFYGKSTFYGEFQTKAVVTSKQGNICCWVVNTIFNKKV